MKKNNRITPEGTRDFLFEECIARRRIEKKLTDVFSARGYHEVVTPGIEFYDVFDPDFSGIGQEVMYKLTDSRGRLIVMRPDSTLPIARLTATRLQNQEPPIRLYYTQPIYRCHPGLTGRSDESVQTGIELLGADGMRADLEVISTAFEALEACVPGYRLELGHAGFFRTLSEQLPVSDEVRGDIRKAIGSKNYAALNEILDQTGDCAAARTLRELPRLFGGEEVFAKAAPLCGSRLGEMLDSLHAVYRSVSELNPGGKLMVDLGLVQRNDYYSSIVFSAYTESCGDAVLLGGRYNHLLEHFGQPMPAVGFAMNVDAIAESGHRRNHGKGETIPAPDVLVHAEAGFEVKALRYRSRLAASGLRAEYSVFSGEEEAVSYAKRRGIPRVDVVGGTIRPLERKQN